MTVPGGPTRGRGSAWCDVWLADEERGARSGDALLRAVLGRYGVKEAVVDRRCPACGGPHGRPVVRGSAFSVSVSRTSGLTAVAVADRPVGVDVERIRPLHGDPRGLGPAPTGIPAVTAVLRQWCRYEAVVKATGDGVRTPFHAVRTDRHAAIRYHGAPLDGAVLDLDVGDGHVAAVAVLGGPEPDVRVAVLRPQDVGDRGWTLGGDPTGHARPVDG